LQSLVNIGNDQATWISLVQDNPTNSSKALETNIHFSPANGFPAGSYLEFLNLLAGHHSVTSMDCRGSWHDQAAPGKNFGMADFANDLIAGIKAKHTQPVIGIGHSLGGHISAIDKHPELFSALVLIEPATLPSAILDYIYPLLPKSLIYQLFPFMKGSAQRQRIWTDREEFRQKYQSHPTFKRFSAESFENYISHGLRKNEAGELELSFHPAWEAHVFRKMEFLWKHIGQLSMPTLLINAEHSNLYTPQRFSKLSKNMGPHIQTQMAANSHHLLALEKPELTATIALEWLANSVSC